MEQKEVATFFFVVEWNSSLILDKKIGGKGVATLQLTPTLTKNRAGQIQISIKHPVSGIKPGDWIYFGKHPFVVTGYHDQGEHICVGLGNNLTVHYNPETSVDLWVN